MPNGKVTKVAVDRLEASSAPLFLWDTELKGFGVKATPSGAKTYVFQYRIGGRGAPTRRATIGRHGALTPDQARTRAIRLAAKVADGIDPVQEQREADEAARATAEAQERERQRVAEHTVDRVAARFLDRKREETPRSIRFLESIVRAHIRPAIGDRSIRELTAIEIEGMLERIPAAQASVRRNIYTVTRMLLRWAERKGLIDDSPLARVDAPQGPSSRDRVLTDDELALVWSAAAATPYPFGPFYRLLILTAARREEVAALDWSELDRGARLWRLPAARAKNGNANVLPLSEGAIDALDLAAGVAGKDLKRWPKTGLVFSSNGRTPISGFSKAKLALDRRVAEMAAAAEIQVRPWRLHDLRRTAATGFQRLGVRFEVTEAILNHVERARGGIAGVYQRHGWADEKKDALETWLTHLLSICAAARSAQPIGQSNLNVQAMESGRVA